MNFQVMAASPAANISPLEFRGWLQRHVAQMESPADGARVIKMRVKPRPSGRGRKARSDIENVAAMAD